MQQMLEDWYNKSTFAIATWRGDAQKYWQDQVLETARARHDKWVQSPRDRRASLESAYILGTRKLIPEAANSVESVLRTELLDAIPKTMADACMRQHCRAHYLVHHEAVDPTSRCERSDNAEGDPYSTEDPSLALDQASKWLE